MGAVSKVAIIGCGSVGSYIVEALSEYGISSFIFVDNDKAFLTRVQCKVKSFRSSIQ